jgi:predicted phosphodiesterase
LKIAIFGDIHSNYFAFQQLLVQLKQMNIEHVIITGDIFGYYPWACETYDLLNQISCEIHMVKGNHDQLILDKVNKSDLSLSVSYWPAIEQNLEQLQNHRYEGIKMLETLDSQSIFKTRNFTYSIFHGTPDDTLNGRYYPDDNNSYSWFPPINQITILGHTHYPIVKQLNSGGLILNPGSVGQPRDGNVNPSWIFIDEEKGLFLIKRFDYEIHHAIDELKKINWNDRAIRALLKSTTGKLI